MNGADPEMVVEGLVETGPGGPHLIGSHCLGCGTLYFPQMPGCPNPDCHDKRLEQTLLPDEGTLYSYTIQRFQPPPLFRMDDWAPYVLGLVDLGAGLRVMGMLSGIGENDVEIGMKLRLAIEPLYHDTERGEVCTYKFAAAGDRP